MRLKEDNTSWKSGGIKRRDFRHDPGLPETEAPRHAGIKRKKKKHIHDYKRIVIGKTTRVERYRSYDDTQWLRQEYEVDKVQFVCTGCGHKRNYYWGWR